MRSAPKSGVLARLPAEFWEVPYVPARFPGAEAIAERPGIEHGANCQYYAYEVLRHFGLDPPPLRSSELWADTIATVRVSEPECLDLVLFNATGDAWGAHVGVHVADDQVLHLCVEIGHPIVWPYEAFQTRTRYRTLIGAKRVLPRADPVSVGGRRP